MKSNSKKENKIKIVYRYQKYNVTFLNAFKYCFLRIILLFRRARRMCKRLLKYVLVSIPVIICVLPFIALLTFIGLKNDVYKTLFEGIWDFKAELLTTILVPYVTFATISEINRHKALIEQRNLYEYFVYESSCFLENISNILLLGERVIVSFDEDSFIGEVEKRKFNRKLEIHRLLFYFEMYNKILDHVKGRIGSIELIGRIKNMKYYNINYLQNEVITIIFELKNEKYKNESDYWKNKIISLFNTIYPISANMRDPWRSWDKDINEEIKKCLSE